MSRSHRSSWPQSPTRQRSGFLQRVRDVTLHMIPSADQKGRVFRSQTTYLKAPYFYENIGITDSLVGICDPHKHKVHRAIVNPLFSRVSLGKLAPIVGGIVEHAAEITKQRFAKGQPVDVQTLYRCITVSIVQSHVYAGTLLIRAIGRCHIYLSFRAYARPHHAGSE